MDISQSKRKPYVRQVKKSWWLRNSFYTGYMLREGTCIFVGAYAVILLCGLLRLSQGPEAFAGWLAASRHASSAVSPWPCASTLRSGLTTGGMHRGLSVIHAIQPVARW